MRHRRIGTDECPNGSPKHERAMRYRIEQRTFNPLVEGSNPSRPTTLNQHLNWCFFMPKIQDKDFPTLFSKKHIKK